MSLIKLCEDVVETANRIHMYNGNIYYNIDEQKSICISKDKIKWIFNNQLDFLFNIDENFVSQVKPYFKDKINNFIPTIKSIFNIDDKYLLLFSVYIVSSLLPNINHPILCLTRDFDSAKSTALRFLARIISLSKNDLFTLNKKFDDIIPAISGQYFIPFDNVSNINQDISNILCQTVTNGTISKRRLYTDNEMFTINLHNLIAINGFNLNMKYSDLLDRSIIIPFNRIEASQRKTEQEVWCNFNKVLPVIFETSIKIISKAMNLVDNLSVSNLPRMADFSKWGYAIAEVIKKGSGNEFLNEYRCNLYDSIEGTSMQDDIVYYIVQFMSDKTSWFGNMTELLQELKNLILKDSTVQYLPTSFPKTANALSRKLNRRLVEFDTLGFNIVIGRATDRFIEINRKNTVGIVDTVANTGK